MILIKYVIDTYRHEHFPKLSKFSLHPTWTRRIVHLNTLKLKSAYEQPISSEKLILLRL